MIIFLFTVYNITSAALILQSPVDTMEGGRDYSKNIFGLLMLFFEGIFCLGFLLGAR